MHNCNGCTGFSSSNAHSNYLHEWWHDRTGSIYSLLQGKEYFDLCLGRICNEFVANIP